MVSKSETELCALEITIRIVERWLVVLWTSCGNFHRNIVTLPLSFSAFRLMSFLIIANN